MKRQADKIAKMIKHISNQLKVDGMASCLNVKFSIWWNIKFVKLKVSGMANGWNGKLMKWPFTIEIRVKQKCLVFSVFLISLKLEEENKRKLFFENIFSGSQFSFYIFDE